MLFIAGVILVTLQAAIVAYPQGPPWGFLHAYPPLVNNTKQWVICVNYYLSLGLICGSLLMMVTGVGTGDNYN